MYRAYDISQFDDIKIYISRYECFDIYYISGVIYRTIISLVWFFKQFVNTLKPGYARMGHLSVNSSGAKPLLITMVPYCQL